MKTLFVKAKIKTLDDEKYCSRACGYFINGGYCLLFSLELAGKRFRYFRCKECIKKETR